MSKEFYIKKVNHQLVLTTNDRFDVEAGEYEVIAKTIRKIITFLNGKYNLYTFYLEYKSSISTEKLIIPINKFFKNEVVVFEKVQLEDFNTEYISERFILGCGNIEMLLKDCKIQKFDSFKNICDFLKDNCQIFCKIYDSSYIEINTNDIKTIISINELV